MIQERVCVVRWELIWRTDFHKSNLVALLQMNEIRKGGPRAAMRPLPITPPSMSSVLDTLNMINGIFLIPVR